MTVRSLLLLALTLLLGCGAPAARPSAVPGSSAAAVETFARAGNELGLELFRRLGRGNLAVSPASVSTALAMTYGGARGASATQMARTLHVATAPDETLEIAGALVRAWNDPTRTSYELSVANRLFGERTYAFSPGFLDATRERLGAELQPVDFVGAPDPSRVQINEWVSERTHARIPEILPAGSVDSDIRLVLVNAVYFHGAWQSSFDPSETTEQVFHAEAGDVRVPTMSGNRTGYGENDEVQVLELPYAGGDVSMLFVLPRSLDGLDHVEAQLSAERIERWHALVHGEELVGVSLPRFRIETGPVSLREPLTALGMGALFTPEADLTGMSAPGAAPLFLSDVFHRVFVELNEEGTEAAAATAVLVQLESVGSPAPRYFRADHPFLFFLRDTRSGALLFSGRVVDPS